MFGEEPNLRVSEIWASEDAWQQAWDGGLKDALATGGVELPEPEKFPSTRSGAAEWLPDDRRAVRTPARGYFQRLMNSAVAGLTSSGFEALRKCWPPSTTRSSAPGLLTKSCISSSALATE